MCWVKAWTEYIFLIDLFLRLPLSVVANFRYLRVFGLLSVLFDDGSSN